MKKIVSKLSSHLSTVMVAMALFVTSGLVNTGCYIFMYQPELPSGAEELYK